ncbi:MAG: hypothetical protein JKY65_01270 [Planctomycetes bacterium]|nr:hypothetical protein [Planctomycetota bacterium]
MSTQVLTIYPTEPKHRLAQGQLSAFLERVSRHLIALGEGATAKLRAGPCEAESRSWAGLVVDLDQARRRCNRRDDLEIRLEGPVRERFGRFLGARRLSLRFEAFVDPRQTPDGAAVFWWLKLSGPGPAGVGERLQEDGRDLLRSPFVEALEGTARVRLALHEEWT